MYHVHLAGSSGLEVDKDVTQPVLVLQASEVAALGDLGITIEAESATGERVSASTTLRLPHRQEP